MSKRFLVHGAASLLALSTFQCSADEPSASLSSNDSNGLERRSAAACGTVNAALNRPTTASSLESGAFPANAATDGNTGTRWSSQFADPQWLQVDLGSVQTICGAQLQWETAYGKAYQIQVSNDGSSWSDIYSTTSSPGGTESLTISGTGRYVRILGTQRATQWGYSLWEFQVFTTGAASDAGGGDSGTNPPAGFWDASGIPAPQNVLVFKFLNRTHGVRKDTELFWSFKSGSINETHSFAERPLYDMPANSAGRLYFYICITGDTTCASDPTKSKYFDFIEHTIGPHQYNGNTTRVDAFGLKIAMLLHSQDGSELTVGEDYATFAEDRAATFQKFVDSVPSEFKGLAQPPNAPYRIVEPGAGGFNAGGPYQHYYDSYANALWSANGITIPKPGPNGDGLAAYPDLSAALYRHVGAAPGTFDSAGHLLNHQLWTNPATFYTASPANYYAKFWHDHAIGAKAYGFPYDDVGGYSTFISHDNPRYLLVAVGW